ncbi:MAG: methyltransferase type 11 [Isosphaeraceae bacterium]|jgi:SAM-dependent methyltransferase|nr:MAG: methyltransferase type 11 [Isosphaeraceae bacterium]
MPMFLVRSPASIALLVLTTWSSGPLLAVQAPDPAEPAGSSRSTVQRPKTPPAADPHAPWGRNVVRGTYRGRPIAPVMSYLGADWLIRPERELEEQPERMLDALQIRPGMVVADVGAGVGYTSVRIARRVVPGGKVLATDVQPEMIAILRDNIRTLGLQNVITPIRCTPTDPKLPAGQVDLAILVDVYHECTHPEETLRGLYQALKPDGRLVLVEFRAEDPEVPIKPEHKMSVAQILKELEPQGFRLKERHDFLPWQHLLVFEKKPVPGDPSNPETPLSPTGPGDSPDRASAGPRRQP